VRAVDEVAANVEQRSSAAPIEQPMTYPENKDFPTLDDELREWKLLRAGGFQIPWRQLSLMASLCFGIASLVLPDSVNENVQWLLYALTAASLIAGFARRRRATK